MIHAIDLFFCSLTTILFKNFLTLILFFIVGYIILKFLIQKLSNISILLYLLLIITLFTGGLVLWLLPKEADPLSDEVVNSYYLGTLAFVLFVALLISVIYDLYTIYKEKNKKKKIKKSSTIKVDEVKPKKESKIEIKEKPVKKTVKKINTEKKADKTKKPVKKAVKKTVKK